MVKSRNEDVVSVNVWVKRSLGERLDAWIAKQIPRPTKRSAIELAIALLIGDEKETRK